MPHKARPLRTFWIYSDTSGVLLRWWTLAQTQTHQLVASTAMISVHHNRVTTSAEEEGSNNHSDSIRRQGVTVVIIAKVIKSRDKMLLTQRSHESFFSVFFRLQYQHMKRSQPVLLHIWLDVVPASRLCLSLAAHFLPVILPRLRRATANHDSAQSGAFSVETTLERKRHFARMRKFTFHFISILYRYYSVTKM